MDNVCTIHFLPAKAGDCLLFEFDNKECILIDGGYSSTYNFELKPLLKRLSLKGCKIVLMVVTHIDQDHIEGAISLIKENGPADKPKIIEIQNVWFNGFFSSIYGHNEFVRHHNEIIKDDFTKKVKEFTEVLHMRNKGEKGYISASQCACFERLCIESGYNMNAQFPDKVVKRGDCIADREASIIIGACGIKVFNPSRLQIEKLARELHVAMVKRFGVKYEISKNDEIGKLFELLMQSYEELPPEKEQISATGGSLRGWLGTSSKAEMNAVNRASIVLQIEYKGIKILCTGDADSEDWSECLESRYDVIKASHHGTTKPNEELIKVANGDIYLISTNGGKNKRHPEKEFLAQLILQKNRNLYFNYDIQIKDELLEMQEENGFNAYFGIRKICIGDGNED